MARIFTPDSGQMALLDLVPRAITGNRPQHLIWNSSPERFIYYRGRVKHNIYLSNYLSNCLHKYIRYVESNLLFVLLFGCIIQRLSLNIIAVLDGIQPISLIFIYEYTSTAALIT